MLVHGLGERATSWDSLRDALAACFTTYAVDLRGHGASDPADAYSHALLETDLSDMLDALGLSGVVLVGHSLGGNLALRVAAHRPDLVDRLVIEDVIPPWPRTREIPSRPERELAFDWAAVPALMTEASTYDAEAWRELGAVAAPTLLVSGRSSHLPQEKVEEMARSIPDCELHVLEAGHHVHRDAPDAFSAVVLGWLAAPS